MSHSSIRRSVIHRGPPVRSPSLAAIVSLVALTVACESASSDSEPHQVARDAAGESVERTIRRLPQTSVASSRPVKPRQCDPLEPAPPLYMGGSCTFEIRLDQVENVSGQGISEGNMEVSVEASADNNPSVAWPSSDALVLPGSVLTNEFYAGQASPTGDGMVLATVMVASGDRRTVPACATFTEHDDGGANGGDDTGTACTNVTMAAISRPGGKVECVVSPAAPTATTDLCGDNVCNGRFRAHFEVKVADADGDQVANEEDFTPDICDEELKGQLGRGSLVYFYMGDGPMNSLGQHLGTDLSKALTGYDFTVVVIDSATAGPFLLNAAALKNLTDLTLPPSEESLYEGMEEITKRGYDMDLWIWSHGTMIWDSSGITSYTKFETPGVGFCTDVPEGELCGNGQDDDNDGDTDEADCAPIPSGELCWTFADEDGDGIIDEREGIWDYEITQQLAPARIGTDQVPIRMVYSGACFHDGMNWAWDQVGAYVTSGALGINFYPNYYGAFADSWNAGVDYGTSVSSSPSAGARLAVHGYMSWLSAGFDCDDIGNGVLEEGLSVLNTNPCSRDFFVDDGDGDEYKYNIGDDFDRARSGIDNMDDQSIRGSVGDLAIEKYMPPTLSW